MRSLIWTSSGIGHLAFLLFFCLAGQLQAQPEPVFETVSLTRSRDSLGPGISAGVVFTRFEQVSTNERGDALFVGEFEGPGVIGGNNGGIFIAPISGPRMIAARLGDVAPGIEGARFTSFLRCGIDNNRHVAFIALVSTPSGVRSGVWTFSGSQSGSPQPRLLQGQSFPIPGYPNAIVDSLYDAILCVNQRGGMALKARVLYDPVGFTVDALWAGPSVDGPFDLAACQRMDVAGLPAGMRLTEIGPPSVNQDGAVVYTATRNGGGVSDGRSLLLYANGQSQVIASSTAMSQERGFFQPVLSDSGVIHALAQYGTAPYVYQPWILFMDGPALRPMWQDPQAPETPAGVTFSQSLGSSRVSSTGHSVFGARLSDGSYAKYIQYPHRGPLRKVARTSEPLPGLPTDLRFWYFGSYVADHWGRVLLVGHLRTSPQSASQLSAWVWEPESGLQLVVRPSDTVLCGDGVIRTVIAHQASLGDRQSSSLAADGYVVLALSLYQPTTGVQDSGVFRVHVSRKCGTADIAAAGAATGWDGLLDNNDLIVFIDRFFYRAVSADIGGRGGEPGSDGVFDNNDFIVFVDAFFTGCN